MNYRCDRCGRRRSGRYRKQPECCGREMRDDTHNVRRWNAKQQQCDCGLIPYPHREGSSAPQGVCSYHPDADPWQDFNPTRNR